MTHRMERAVVVLNIVLGLLLSCAVLKATCWVDQTMYGVGNSMANCVMVLKYSRTKAPKMSRKERSKEIASLVEQIVKAKRINSSHA